MSADPTYATTDRPLAEGVERLLAIKAERAALQIRWDEEFLRIVEHDGWPISTVAKELGVSESAGYQMIARVRARTEDRFRSTV